MATNNAEVNSFVKEDKKIGIIRIYVITGEEVEEPKLVLPMYPVKPPLEENEEEEVDLNPPPNETEEFDVKGIRILPKAETEYCFVYESQRFEGRPYYLTREGTRVLIIDSSRIHRFQKPGGPSEEEQELFDRLGIEVMDYELRAQEVAVQKAKAEAARKTAMAKKVGEIVLQVPHKRDEFERPPQWIFKEEKRNVYIDFTEDDAKRERKWLRKQKKNSNTTVKLIYEDEDKPDEPEYYVLSGDRKLQILKERINFLESYLHHQKVLNGEIPPTDADIGQ